MRSSDDNMTFGAVIISRNTSAMTVDSLESLRRCGIKDLVLVDNDSDDGTVDAVRELFPDIVIIANKENTGYAKAVNIGVGASSSKFVMAANADTIFNETVFDGFNTLAEDDKIGVCAGRQLFPDGSPQRSYGFLFDMKGVLSDLFYVEKIVLFLENKRYRSGKPAKMKTVDYADGAALWLDRDLFDRLGGFDERFFFYGEEADYCKRVADAGKKVVFEPKVNYVHYRGASSGGEKFTRAKIDMLTKSKVIFARKHFSPLKTKIQVIFEVLHHAVNALAFAASAVQAGQKGIEKSRINLDFAKSYIGNLRK